MPRRLTPYAAEVRLARKAKSAGITKEEFVNARMDAIVKGAQAGGWINDRVCLAMMTADVTMAAEEIYDSRERGAHHA